MLKEKILKKQARIGILGLGYVGLPLGIEYAKAGFHVTGFDLDKSKIEAIKKCKSYVVDIEDDVLKEVHDKLSPTDDFSLLSKMDVIIICVPTPLRKSKDPDISYIVNATEKIVKCLHKNQVVILESTTYPGTTKELVLPMLEKTGLKIGKDFYLGFSPERVDPGNKFYKTYNTPKIISGITAACCEMVSLVYKQIIQPKLVISVSSTESAEMVKLLENTFRAVNIGLVNEIALICDRLKLNVWEIINAAGTKPYGFMPFYPGPGLGGHCIPIDPHYLSWKMKTLNYHPRFIELAEEINSQMPEYVVRRITDLMNERNKSVKSAKILVLGIAYKRDVSDVRESPSLDVIKLLKDKGAVVSYNDPYVREFILKSIKMHSVPLTPNTLRKYDCVVILTDHSDYNYHNIVKNAKLIFDTRNATKAIENKKISRL